MTTAQWKSRNSWCKVMPLALALIAFAGCSSLDSSIQQSLSKGNYRIALAQLEAKKAGVVPESKLKPDRVKARDRYQSTVETNFLSQGLQLYEQGKARSALSVVEEGAQLCVWSIPLQQRVREYRDFITLIEHLHEDWKGKETSLRDDVAQSRRFLNASKPFRLVLAEFPEVQRLVELAESAVILNAAKRVAAHSFQHGSSEMQKIVEEVGGLGTMKGQSGAVTTVLSFVATLPSMIAPTNPVTSVVGNFVGNFDTAISGEGAARHDFTAAFWHSISAKLQEWVRVVFLPALEHRSCATAYLNLGESIAVMSPEELRTPVRNAVATAYLNRAETWAGSGLESLLALIYLERYDQLKGTNQNRTKEIRAIASSALANALPIRSDLNIDIGPKIEPYLTASLYWRTYSEVVKRTKSWHQWNVVNSERSKNTLAIDLDEAQMIVEGVKQLSPVRSSYFSHFEKVINPAKSALASQVESARLQANWAESSYNSAVSSHNIYPTAYSLAAVNNARSSYYSAIEHHNSLVQIYNYTPETISRAVNLPYTFYEGDVRFGWSLDAAFSINTNRTPRHVEAIVSDHVRAGTKFGDTSADRRRDDPVDIDMTTEALIQHLSTAIDKLYESVNGGLMAFRYSSRRELEEHEQEMIAWMLHPWGPQESLLSTTSIPRWVSSISTERILQFDSPKPPEVFVTNSGDTNNNLSAEDLAKLAGKVVCQIIGDGREGAVVSGSGVIISADGLILTCAHVVGGRTLRIKIHEGENVGNYAAEVVYINTKRDVALIRANQLKAATWANLRLEANANRGEEVIAVGNPSLPTGEVNKLGVSRGVVSNPEAEVLKDPYLVADINIASGSSGGPLFSSKDGAVVGVVLAIASPKILKDGVSSSGFTCLAAPVPRLREWLGLRSGNPPK